MPNQARDESNQWRVRIDIQSELVDQCLFVVNLVFEIAGGVVVDQGRIRCRIPARVIDAIQDALQPMATAPQQ